MTKPCTRIRTQAFTLVELMTVMAILLILAALAYPSYAAHVVKARRTQAQAALLELLQRQEQHFTRHNTYLAFAAGEGAPDARHMRWHSGSTPAGSGHELRAAACEDAPIARCVVLTAVPGTERVDRHFRDPECGTLVLYSSGRRAADGPLRRCWP